MLITTSRKPSQKTRTFCRGLERVLKARCVNRGKMSLRDVFLKAKEMGMGRVMVISERDGNPKGMDIYMDGELFASIELTVDFSLPKGRMKKNETCLRSEVEELKELICQIFDIPLEREGSDYPKQKSKYLEPKSDCNLLWIRPHQRKSIPVMEFFDANGQPTGPRVYLYQWKLSEEADESS